MFQSGLKQSGGTSDNTLSGGRNLAGLSSFLLRGLVLLCTAALGLLVSLPGGRAQDEKEQKRKEDQERAKTEKEDFRNSYRLLAYYEDRLRALDLQIAVSCFSLRTAVSPEVPTMPLMVSRTLDAKRKQLRIDIDFHKQRLEWIRGGIQGTALYKELERELGLIQ